MSSVFFNISTRYTYSLELYSKNDKSKVFYSLWYILFENVDVCFPKSNNIVISDNEQWLYVTEQKILSNIEINLVNYILCVRWTVRSRANRCTSDRFE